MHRFWLYHVIGYRRKVVRTNLKNSFPEKSAAELKAIERKFFHYLCDQESSPIMGFMHIGRLVGNQSDGHLLAGTLQLNHFAGGRTGRLPKYLPADWNRPSGKNRPIGYGRISVGN